MNLKKLAVILIFCFGIFAPGAVQAEVISFSDNSIYWPGWSNGTADDHTDSIGIPNFTGGTANVVGDKLYSITFTRQTGSASDWADLSLGDLFIDTAADKTWNYVVDLTSWTVSGPNVPDPAAGNYNVYSVNVGLDDPNAYILSGHDNTGLWAGFGIRDGHPVALKDLPSSAFSSAYFSGWGDGSTTQYTFDFGANGLDLGPSGAFTIGLEPNCANDVVYETLHYTPTPEPSTMALFAFGLAGLYFRFKRGKVLLQRISSC